jgi:hypothetical protein
MNLLKLVFAITLMFLSSCNNQDKVNRFNDEELYKYADSVTVYGDFHLSSLSSMSFEVDSVLKTIGLETQNWLFRSISEKNIVGEALFFTGKPIDSSLSVNAKVLLLNDQNAVSLFYRERKVSIYGGEDSVMYSEGAAYVINNIYNNQVSPEEFTEGINKNLDDRSRHMAESAMYLAKSKKEKVAIIIGEKHLSWFQKNGFKTKSINSSKRFQDYISIIQ